MKATRFFLIVLSCGILLQTARAREIVVSPGDDLKIGRASCRERV